MDEDEVRCVKLRGIPWTTKKEDVLEFFNDCKIYKGEDGIHLIRMANGRLTGEAYVEVPPDDDIDVFLRKDKKCIGHRYIEVFKVRRSEMEWAVKKSGEGSAKSDDDSSSSDDEDESRNYVRLRGLPYDCTKSDIERFFEGLEIASNGIQIMEDNFGRPSGEAYVELASKEQTEKARARDRECIGPRYIEVFRVSHTELRDMKDSVSRCGRYSDRHHPYDRGNRYGGGGGGGYGGRSSYHDRRDYDDRRGYGRAPVFPGIGRVGGSSSSRSSGREKNCVLMRGVPFRATEYDIRRFFEPITPLDIDIIYESSGRPSGTAKVTFANGDDVTRAMGKHKERMEHRYIELFLHH